ncbi:hypothetical protein [Desulfogranum marinum]|uniref:hypothetical protein n=1 Tax=Desulfogranum marinum TaxID=453220 RepID=UPI0029C88BB1|nr:hypothetical protein [Desulfogranum marinum]
MDQYEFIRTAHCVYGKNVSELSRMNEHSWDTVKEAIRGEPWGYRERERQSSSEPTPIPKPLSGIFKVDPAVVFLVTTALFGHVY